MTATTDFKKFTANILARLTMTAKLLAALPALVIYG